MTVVNVISCFYLFISILPLFCHDEQNRVKCQTASPNFYLQNV